MRIPNVESSITKYLTHSITSEELDNLIIWLKGEEYGNVFNSYVQIDYLTRHIMSQYNAEKAKRRLLKKIREDKRFLRKLLLIRLSKYAAIVVVLLGLGYSYLQKDNLKDTIVASTGQSVQITLQLSDGSIKTISEEGSTSVFDKNGYRVGLQQGNQLIYHRASTAKEIVYNTLNVPYGKRFVLILSDGTKVHLNSGTSFKYPIEFLNGENRQVFLKGEGYFDVAEDKAHPFIINANEINVRVLGTEFNLSAYPDDKCVETVLVEGSVGFLERDSKFDEKNQRLEPGQIALWKKQDRTMDFKETDTDLYTGWMDGKIIFSHMRFGDIIKKLERNYNVSIDNAYPDLNEAKFTASFDTETIAQVLQAFKKNFPMHFTIAGDRIRIEKP